jgi:hypothetical protein
MYQNPSVRRDQDTEKQRASDSDRNQLNVSLYVYDKNESIYLIKLE